MLNDLLEKLKDRPILSILLCVALSEIIQLIIVLVSDTAPAFHYGIAVMALIALFVTPLLLSHKKEDREITPESEGNEELNDEGSKPEG